MAASSGHLGVKTEAVATHVTHPHWYSPPPRKAPRPLLLGDPFPSRPGRRVLPTPSCPPHSLSAVWPAPSPGPSHGGSGTGGGAGQDRAGKGRVVQGLPPAGPGGPARRVAFPPPSPLGHTRLLPHFTARTQGWGSLSRSLRGPSPARRAPPPHTHALQQGWRQVPRSGPSRGALRPLDSAGRPQPPRACAPPVAERGSLASVPSVGRDQALAVSADSASARLWLWGQDQARPTGGRDGQTHRPSAAWAPHG